MAIFPNEMNIRGLSVVGFEVVIQDTPMDAWFCMECMEPFTTFGVRERIHCPYCGKAGEPNYRRSARIYLTEEARDGRNE